jgi:NAD(P)-dependent dehydrogenase (short-subunit alcohol dehydrogenase family)
MDLAGKVALVTGGKRIGGVVAAELARRGASVAVVYRSSRAEADAVVSAILLAGGVARAVGADLADPAACDRVVADTVSAFDRLDVLVNMASIYRAVPLDALTLADWDASLAVDLRAAWLCSRAAVPHMRRVGGGRIVNFSDWVAASRRPRYVGYLPYYVAKAGVVALTEALALELAPSQILVNAIAPGPIAPPEGSTDDEIRAVERATPLGRWGGAAAIAQVVVSLVESDFVTGETVRVDGGRHLK